MTSSLNLVALIGSLRTEAFSRVVFNAAAELAPPAATLTEVSLTDVPFYNGDVEAAGDPESVKALKEAVIEADGFIVFTPEYNRSMPAVVKNAIDWLSRVPGDSALTNAAAGVVASTPGRHDAAGVRRHLTDSLSLTTGHFFPETLAVSSVSRMMTDGRLTDPDALDSLGAWLGAYVDHIRNRPVEAEKT